jgi:hypothetical protein
MKFVKITLLEIWVFLVFFSTGFAQTSITTEDNEFIPNICFPITDPGAIPYIVFDTTAFPVLDPQPLSLFDGVFYVREFFPLDSDEDGLNEAYAFGTLRSSNGGTAPPTAWKTGTEWINLDIGPKFDEADLHEKIKTTEKPKIAIRVSDWRCTVLSYRDGNIPRQ